MIWFSVSAEIQVPTARQAAPSSRYANSALNADTSDTVPNAVKISGIITATVSGRANTTTSARNLPSTMPGILTGWSAAIGRSCCGGPRQSCAC